MRDDIRFCKECGTPVAVDSQVKTAIPETTSPDLVDGLFACPYCNAMIPDESVLCGVCGERVTVYTPPEGFEFDSENQRFYRTELDDDGAKWVTWFDANAGTYEQVSYPAEQTDPEPTPEPEAIEQVAPVSDIESISNSDPESAQEPAQPQPTLDIPEGFMLDENSGLYYKAMPGKDATGAIGKWYTWFYPDTGEFQQQFHAE